MPSFDLPRRLAAEALGTALLVAAVVGSGIMATNLTSDVALALLANSLATGAILIVLISLLAPISGAHFNPVVSLVAALRREMPLREAGLYAAVQIVAGIAGTMIAHLMFELPLLDRVHEDARRRRSVVRRGARGLRPGRDRAPRQPVQSRGGAVARRAVHRRRVLVHRLDLVRESGSGDCAGIHGFLRRYPSGRRSGLCRRGNCWRDCRARPYLVAPARCAA